MTPTFKLLKIWELAEISALAGFPKTMDRGYAARVRVRTRAAVGSLRVTEFNFAFVAEMQGWHFTAREELCSGC